MSQMARTEIGFQMLCAWNNIDPKDAPASWSEDTNEWTREAWARVAVAALKAVQEPTPAMLQACAEAAKYHLDALPARQRAWRLTPDVKARIRYQAMLQEAIDNLSAIEPANGG